MDRGLRQRLQAEGHEVAPTRAPGGPVLEQVRPCDRDDEDRDAPAPLREVVDEVERPGIGPVEILEHERGRPLRGDPLEEGPPGAEQLLAGDRARGIHAEQREERRLDPATLGLVGHPALDRGGDLRPGRGLVVRLHEPRAAPDHLAQGPERDALAVRGRPAGVPVDRLHEAVDVVRQLPDEPRLARARGADDRDDPCPPLPAGRVQEVLEEPELGVAPDERRLELIGAAASAALGDDPDRPERGHGRLLALEHLVAGRLEGDRPVRGTLRRLADEDRPGLRDRLEARCRVDDVAGDHPLVRGADRHGRLAGQHARASVQPGTQRPDRLDELECGANGQLRIVLAGDRCAPHGHDRVADELLDRAAVAADHDAGQLEVAREQLTRLLRVAALGEGREADEVREQDRDQPAFGDRTGGRQCPGRASDGARPRRLAVSRCRAGRRAALGAELGAGEERGAARSAARLQGVAALGTEARVGRYGEPAPGTRHTVGALDDPPGRP